MANPRLERRQLTEQEAVAYQVLLERMLPQFEVFRVIGIDEGDAICITLDTVDADGSTYLQTPYEVTHFLNFLKMQQMLSEGE
jgi:hypothetical protein